MKTIEMEILLASHFDFRQKLIVPNVSWGLWIDHKPLHECDLLICTQNNYLWEVEIKISMSDLKADKKKSHGHYHKAIKRLYFAVPENFKNYEKHIPNRAGIITVGEDGPCKIVRKAKENKKAMSISNKQKAHLAHLGAMRIWGLKRKVNKN